VTFAPHIKQKSLKILNDEDTCAVLFFCADAETKRREPFRIPLRLLVRLLIDLRHASFGAAKRK
jgi:hypothetical protein